MTEARRAAALAFLVAGAFFMENLDGTVIATALPQMARSFGTTPVGLSVCITAYLLALAVFVPMSGWIADRYGARTVFASAIAVFVVASVLCGLSQSVPEFTFARVLQGVGGAMMVPVGRLVVLKNTEKRDLVRAIATITWPGLAAPVLGPVVGGLIVDHASWRWIFFLNVPLGLVALLAALRIVPNVREPDRSPFDGHGFVLVGFACLGLSLGVDRVTAPDARPAEVVGLLVVGSALGVAAVRHLRRAAHPLIRFDALSIPTFLALVRGGSAFRCAISATPFLLPLLFQVGFGLKATASGVLVLCVFAGNFAMKPATTAILRRFGFRASLLINGALAALTILTLSFLSPETPKALVVAVLFAGGMCRSMQLTALNTLGFADVPPDLISGANVLSSTIGGLAFGSGAAFGAIALKLASGLHHTSGPNPSLAGFRVAFTLVALVAFVSLWEAKGLSKGAGQEVSGHTAT